MSQPSLALTMARLRRLGRGGGATLGQAAQLLAERSTPVLIMVLATLGMVPSPGLPLGFVCGAMVVWLAIARLAGHEYAPIPERLGRCPLPASVLDAALRRLVPLLRKVERRASARLTPLATGPGAMVAVVGIGLQGVVMALPIPFGNVPPGLAILGLAGGLVWRDGLGVLAGHLLSLASFGIVGGMTWAAIAALGWLRV